MSTTAPWHVLTLEQPHRWRDSADRLAHNGVECYAPTLKISRRKTEALFSGYLFGRVDVTGWHWHLAKQLAKARILMVNGRAATLSEAAIAAVRQLEAELRIRKPFRIGDRVRLDDLAGAWEGFAATVARLDHGDRVTVQLLIGHRLVVKADWLERA